MKLAIIDDDGTIHIVRDNIEDAALAYRNAASQLLDDIVEVLAQLLK